MTTTLITFISMSIVLGLFVSFIWSTNGFANLIFKIVFSLYTLFAIAMLVIVINPIMVANGMRLI